MRDTDCLFIWNVLQGLSPLKKLNQGYSYVADKIKKTLTSVEQVQNGDTIYISVTDGTIEAQVRGT